MLKFTCYKVWAFWFMYIFLALKAFSEKVKLKCAIDMMYMAVNPFIVSCYHLYLYFVDLKVKYLITEFLLLGSKTLTISMQFIQNVHWILFSRIPLVKFIFIFSLLHYFIFFWNCWGEVIRHGNNILNRYFMEHI